MSTPRASAQFENRDTLSAVCQFSLIPLVFLTSLFSISLTQRTSFDPGPILSSTSSWQLPDWGLKHGGPVTERDVLTIARCQPERRLSERAHRRDRWQSIVRPEPAILLGAAPICRACLGVATFEIDFSLAHARHSGSSEKQPC